LDLDALGDFAALVKESAHAGAGAAQLLAEPAMGDLEAPHGRERHERITVCGLDLRGMLWIARSG
jgi:hypothetical protein